jgi:hypothetical protein
VAVQIIICPPTGGIIPTNSNSLRKLVLIIGDSNRIFFVFDNNVEREESVTKFHL